MPSYVSESEERGPRRQLMTTVVFLALAVTARALPADSQRQIASALQRTLLRPFVLVQEGLAQSRVHQQTTEELQARLDSAQTALSNQRSLAEENSRLREMLGLGERIPANFVAASVIRPGTSMSQSLFFLDVGSARGVRQYATLITGAGLVGVVTEAEAERSTGMDWTHPEFRASAMTEDGAVYGLVLAEAAQFREADRLRLDGVPFQQELSPGTRIVTSGLSGIHPRGIPIGVVVDEAVTEAGAGWRRSYWIRPAVDPGGARHVLALVSTPDSADFSTVWSARDSIGSAGEGSGR